MPQLLPLPVNQRAIAAMLTPFYFLFQSKKLLLRLAMLVMSVGMMSGVVGQATVTNDKPDYAPRSNAVFTGAGFQAFEQVQLKVKNLNRPCNTVTTDSSYLPWTVTADATGAFVTNWTVCDCPGDSLRLKATGLTSARIAYAYFTDGAGTASFDESYFVMNINGGGNIATAFPDFNNADLGTFCNSQSLVFVGGESKIKLCGVQGVNNVCSFTSAKIYYRVYPAGSPSGTFTSFNLTNTNSNYTPSCTGPGTNTGQKWQSLNGSTNILSGLANGNYVIEVYADANYTNCNGNNPNQAGTILNSNDGSNFKATFTVSGAPVITTVYNNISLNNDAGVCGAVVNFAAANATGTPAPTITYSHPSGSVFPVGLTTVSVIATNSCGNDSKTFTVTVNDTEAPSGTSPSAITDINSCLPTQSEANEALNATLAASGYTDNCGGAVTAIIKNAVITGNKCNWTITYTFSVSDQNNNVLDNQTYTRSGGDKTAPTGTAPSAITSVDACLPTQAQADAAFDAALAAGGYSDACSGTVTAELVSAVVSGTKCAWTITYTFKVKDECGNYTANQTYTRSGGDKTAPTWITGVSSLDKTVYCGQLTELSNAQALAPTATDNCGGTLTYIKTSGLFVTNGTNGGGTYINTWIAKDACNNQTVSVFTQTITVLGIIVDANASTTPVAINTAIILKANVSPTEADVTVNFYVDNVLKGSDETDENGLATLNIGSLPSEVYQVKAVVGGGCSESLVYLPVYDPNGGFITGGGWIKSPAGAYIAGPTLSGKANFGFVAKYKKGSSQVDGNTEFQFHVGNFNFKSSLHDAGTLVIAGAKATYKGTGTVNGTGAYGFMVTGIDGQITGGGGYDKFRIRVWDMSNGNQVVYDNDMGLDEYGVPSTAIEGGSIVIHDPKKKTSNRMDAPALVIATQEFNVKVLGNPSLTSFRLQLQGSNVQEKFTVKVVDVNGRLIEVQQNLFAGQVIELGSKYTQGTYFAEVTQGTNRKVVKLVKISRD